MRTSKGIHTVSCHTEGEIGNVIVGGVFHNVNLLVSAKNPAAKISKNT